MNMQVLKKSRTKPKRGDVFALQILDFEFIFGRVISTDAEIGPVDGMVLLYIYDSRSASKNEIPPLEKHRLLIPPTMINYLPWSRGYFENVGHSPLEESDILPVHCFENTSFRDVRYFDEHNNRLKKRIEPCGGYGLSSFRTIDDKISTALGVPRAVDD